MIIDPFVLSSKLSLLLSVLDFLLLKHKMQEYINAERRLLEKLRHPFICPLHFSFQTANKLYLLLDYCPGGGSCFFFFNFCQ